MTFLTGGAEAFFAAWLQLRKQSDIPHFRTIFADMTPELISRLMILEESPPDKFIVRFMGTTVLELRKQELTGQDILATFVLSRASSVRTNFLTLLGHPCGARNISTYATPLGNDIELENVLLPLTNDVGRPRRILSYAQEVGKPAFSSINELRGTRDRRWIDIGWGVPAQAPIAS